MHCVDLGESFPTRIYLQKSASIQPRTSPSKFADRYLPAPCPPGQKYRSVDLRIDAHLQPLLVLGARVVIPIAHLFHDLVFPLDPPIRGPRPPFEKTLGRARSRQDRGRLWWKGNALFLAGCFRGLSTSFARVYPAVASKHSANIPSKMILVIFFPNFTPPLSNCSPLFSKIFVTSREEC